MSDALGHRQDAEIRQTRVVAPCDARPDEAGLDAVGLHDLGMESVRRAEHGEDFALCGQATF